MSGRIDPASAGDGDLPRRTRVARIPEAASEPSTPELPWGPPMRVLLIEADAQDVAIVRERIANDGVMGQVRWTHVDSLAKAERLAHADFDVAVLDLEVGDGSGLDTYLRFAELAGDLPVVVLSGDNDRSLAVAAVRHGAQDYLVKDHISGEALVRVLRYAVERGQVLARDRAALHQERQAGERLRELDQMKDAFLQAVSHELRTPLASVYGYAATLRDHRSQLSEAEFEHVLDRLAANAERLRRLLDDLLDVNRLSAGALDVRGQPTDLAVLAAAAVGHIEMPQHRLELDLQPAPVRAEPAKVERIISNLVENAVKHTPSRTTIWVRTRLVEGAALLTVEDDGPGIDDDLKRDVFRPFHQGPRSRHEANPGTGIGLALVAKFAELHGGRAWTEDRSEGGAMFHVLLPHDTNEHNKPSRPDEVPVADSHNVRHGR